VGPRPARETCCGCCARRRSSARAQCAHLSSCLAELPALAAKTGDLRLVLRRQRTQSLLGPDLVPT
jgi:hypothetical protein